MVEDVEEIPSRLKRKPLGESELPAQRQIDLRSAEAAQGISSQVSLQSRGGYDEGSGIDDLPAGFASLIKVERHSWDYIRTLYAARSAQNKTEVIPPRDNCGSGIAGCR